MSEIKEDQEENYWEWVIALQNGDTNMDYTLWSISQSMNIFKDIWNDTLGNIFIKKEGKNDD